MAHDNNPSATKQLKATVQNGTPVRSVIPEDVNRIKDGERPRKDMPHDTVLNTHTFGNRLGEPVCTKPKDAAQVVSNEKHSWSMEEAFKNPFKHMSGGV